MTAQGRPPALPGGGMNPLDADARGALARFASDIEAVETAIDRRFPAGPVIAGLDRALGAATTSAARTAWTEFYLALQRFVYVASVVVRAPAQPDLAAAFRRFEQILDDDFAHALFAPTERRRLKRRISGLATVPVAAPGESR
jgi:hypothetical protein